MSELAASTQTLLDRAQLDTAMQIAERELRNASEANRPEILWDFEFIRSEIWRIRGRVDRALLRLNALASSSPVKSDTRASLLMHLGYCTAFTGRHLAAQSLLDKALQLATTDRLDALAYRIQLRRAMLLFLKDEYEAAGHTYREIAAASEANRDPVVHSGALSGVGKIEMTLKRFHEAIPWLERSSSVAETFGGRLIVAKNWGELAVCYLGLNDRSKAMDYLDIADEVYLEAGALHSYQINLADRGNVYLEMGDPLTAISFYKRALEYARDMQDPVSIRKWSGNLRLAYVGS